MQPAHSVAGHASLLRCVRVGGGAVVRESSSAYEKKIAMESGAAQAAPAAPLLTALWSEYISQLKYTILSLKGGSHWSEYICQLKNTILSLKRGSHKSEYSCTSQLNTKCKTLTHSTGSKPAP